MWLIDIRRKKQRISSMAVSANTATGISIDEFIRLACINAMAIEETPIDRKVTHYSSDMRTLNYIQDCVMDVLDQSDLTNRDYDKAFRDISALIGTTGTILRPYLKHMSETLKDRIDISIEVNLLKGIIYAS